MKNIFAWLGGIFNLRPLTAGIVIAFVVLFLFGFVAKCHAQAPYVQVSAGETLIRGPAGVIDLGFTWPSGFEPKDFWKADLTLIGKSTFQGAAAPNNFMVRALYVTGYGFLDAGLGLAYVQNYLPYNGGPINLTLELAYRFQRWPVTLTYSHVSDDGTRLPNYGRDMLSLGYRFQN